MNNLVIIQNNATLTSSEIIAEGVGNQHKNVIELVRKYQADLEEFGMVAFETRARLQGQHGGGDTEYALLNEQQATLLLTYMQNTSIVREFKKALVKAFYNQVADRKSMAELTKYEVQIEAGNARIQVSRDKALASQLKLQALKDKLVRDKTVLESKTAKLLSQGALVKGDMAASKLSMPVDTITNLLKAHGSKLKPGEANNALINLGYLEPSRAEVTVRGSYYGRTIVSSKSAHTTLARWFPAEFETLLKEVDQYYADKASGLD